MQTHEDRQHDEEFWQRLQQRAENMTRNKASEITVGKENEEILAQWKHDGVQVTHLPDDEQGILRISCGGGHNIIPFNYCVIRGSLGRCIELLEKSVKALRAAP